MISDKDTVYFVFSTHALLDGKKNIQTATTSTA